MRHGAHGVAILGLATETNKLDTGERRRILEWTAEALRGRLPLAVTVAEPSVHGQVAFVRAAKEAGADWVILQPPAAAAATGEKELLRFFGAVADSTDLPVALQNAAQFLGVGLSNAGLATLHRQHPNVCLLKGEAPAHVIERLVADTDGVYRVFNGRGGMELTESLRAGCAGIIPAPECFDVQVRDLRSAASRDARGRGGGRAPLPKHPAADRVHDELDRDVPLLRQAHRGAAAGHRRRLRPRSRAAPDGVRPADGATLVGGVAAVVTDGRRPQRSANPASSDRPQRRRIMPRSSTSAPSAVASATPARISTMRR